MQLPLSLEQSSFKVLGILPFHTRLFDESVNHALHYGRVLQSALENEAESGGVHVLIDVGKPFVFLLAPWRSVVVLPDEVTQLASRLGIYLRFFPETRRHNKRPVDRSCFFEKPSCGLPSTNHLDLLVLRVLSQPQ